MKRICVFCGSSPGSRPEYVQAARAMGEALAKRGIELVYGGGRVGMMGQLAAAVLANGGKVIGVIPQELVHKEVAFLDLPDLRVVGSMHERKALMAELSDGFIALPGGLGTLEEFFEAVTWAQLGLHRKPCALLDVGQFFQNLTAFLDHAADQQFISPDHRLMILVDVSPDGLLDRFSQYQPPDLDKADWVLRMNGNGTMLEP